MDASALSSRLIGALIVEKGLITEAQLELALEEQQATGARLGEILMTQFGVTRADLETALTTQRSEDSDEDSEAVIELARMLDEWGRNEDSPRKRPIGEIFVERGFITSGQLEDALEEQKLSGRKLGEILVSQGRLSRLRLWDALEDQAASFEDEPNAEPEGPGQTGLRVASDAVSEHAPSVVHQPATEMWKPQQPPKAPARPAVDGASVQAEPAALPNEAVGQLREQVAALTARLDALPQPGDDWRDAVAELGGRLDELTAGSTESHSTLERLTEQLDAERGADRDLGSQVGSLQHRFDELATEVASRLDQVAETVTDEDVRRLAERVENIEQNLVARLQHVGDGLAAAATRDQADRLRRELDDLRAALDALPTPTDDVETLARRVEQLSESFALRLQHVGDAVGGAATRDQADDLRRDLDALRAALDELPAPGGSVDALASQLAELDERLTGRLKHVNDHLAAAATREQAERLRRELDDLRAALDSLPAPTGDVEAISWRVDQLAESISARLEQFGQALGGSATREQTDALRHELGELRGRLESFPLPSDEWREAVAALAARIDDIAHESAEAQSAFERTDALRRELDELRSRFDALPVQTDEWREAIAALAVQIDSAQASNEWSDAVAALAVRLDEIAEPAERLQDEFAGFSHRLRERVDQLERELSNTVSNESIDAVSGRVDGLAHQLEQGGQRLDQAWRRFDDLAPLHRVEELANTTADTASAHGAALDAIREELAAHARRVEEVAEKRRNDKAAVRERLEAIEVSVADASARAAAVEPLQGHLADLDRRIEELDGRISQIASSQSAEHRAALDELRDELRGTAASHGDALDAVRRELDARREDLVHVGDELREELAAQSRRIEEASTSGHAETEALRTDVVQLIEQVAATSAGRAELDDLRARLEKEISDHAERREQDGAAAEATSHAIRDGLAELGRRLISSEQAYFESGRSLRRSIEGLGLAITDADWHLNAEAPQDEAAGYVAFVPAGEGYRLVECEGPAPYLGQVVDLDGFDEVMLRVSRLGRSPLPFDGRPCAYLERLSA